MQFTVNRYCWCWPAIWRPLTMSAVGCYLFTMKILALADDDSSLGSIEPEPIDLVVSLGDLAEPAILAEATRFECDKIFGVKGNHDPDFTFGASIVDLHLLDEKFMGLKFGGFCGSWRYKPVGRHMFTQVEVEDLLFEFPPVDVFVAHNSPRGIHERVDWGAHQGFDAFNAYIENIQPKLFLHGHQHQNIETVFGQTRIVGVFGATVIEI